MREMLKVAFSCNKCGAKHRVRTMRPQKLVRCLCGEVFRVTAEGYEFLNNLPDSRIIGQTDEVKRMIADGRILLATR